MKFNQLDTNAGGISARHYLVGDDAEITAAADGVQVAGKFPLIKSRTALHQFVEQLKKAFDDHLVAKDD